MQIFKIGGPARRRTLRVICARHDRVQDKCGRVARTEHECVNASLFAAFQAPDLVPTTSGSLYSRFITCSSINHWSFLQHNYKYITVQQPKYPSVYSNSMESNYKQRRSSPPGHLHLNSHVTIARASRVREPRSNPRGPYRPHRENARRRKLNARCSDLQQSTMR